MLNSESGRVLRERRRKRERLTLLGGAVAVFLAITLIPWGIYRFGPVDHTIPRQLSSDPEITVIGNGVPGTCLVRRENDEVLGELSAVLGRPGHPVMYRVQSLRVDNARMARNSRFPFDVRIAEVVRVRCRDVAGRTLYSGWRAGGQSA